MLFVWVTLVMLNEDYAKGAAVMARSLRAVNTAYPIWCMVTPDISNKTRRFLGWHFDRIIDVPFISQATRRMHNPRQDELYGAWISHSFTKWNVFNLHADKALFVDADSVFLTNCDELFDIPAPAMTFSSAWAKPYDNRYNLTNHFGRLAHGARVDPALIRRSLDTPNATLAPACMVLIQPSFVTFTIMKEILYSKSQYGHPLCASGLDEQLLAETLLNSRGDPAVYHIHQRYNWVRGKTAWLDGWVARVIQYFDVKPWAQPRNLTVYNEIWHTIWDAIRH
jgi:glycogenin glucosyltransferase